jgi:hypothetical protein
MKRTAKTAQARRKSTMITAHRASRRAFTPPSGDSIAPSRRPASVSPEDRRVQIAAAKARITLDKLTGDVTEEWIVAPSKEKPE